MWQLPVLLGALGNVGLVLVLVIFMLLERLQLRDRLIRLIGFGRIATTTKAMDEAGRADHPLSDDAGPHQSARSASASAWAPYLIGLPYRVPVGRARGASCASFRTSVPGSPRSHRSWWVWRRSTVGLSPSSIAALFVGLELFTNLVLETLSLQPVRGGVPGRALVAVAFWTWIWGPVGLALATPLTVCLVVLAKYVPDLEIVAIAHVGRAGQSRGRRELLPAARGARRERGVGARPGLCAVSPGARDLRRGFRPRTQPSAARPQPGSHH